MEPQGNNDQRRPGRHTVVGLGEILWDLALGARHVGGAPLNFSYISSLLGEHAVIASRVGNDALGDELMIELSQRGVDVCCVQNDAVLPTGTAIVTVSGDGQPDYDIKELAAWNAIEWTLEWERLAEQADAVCFGTLAQRFLESRASIRTFLKSTRASCIRVLDVNLRTPFYTNEVIFDSIGHIASNQRRRVNLGDLLPLLLHGVGV